MEFVSKFKTIKKEEKEEVSHNKPYIEDILFKLPIVSDPLIGTPKEVQKELDAMAKKMQGEPWSSEGECIYDRIHLYMHGYLVNVVLKQFPYIKGMETTDIYQETLIALRFKAIPNFKEGKGMSFLNFAKMCIRRHLITILNASKHRQRDQSMNRAVSLDSPVAPDDDNPNNTFSNLIPDDKPAVDDATEQKEAISVTKGTLMGALSDFERMVLEEYLKSASYKEIARNITERMGEEYLGLSSNGKERIQKAVDNALWRIRKKAHKLKEESDGEGLPLFMNETSSVN